MRNYLRTLLLNHSARSKAIDSNVCPDGNSDSRPFLRASLLTTQNGLGKRGSEVFDRIRTLECMQRPDLSAAAAGGLQLLIQRKLPIAVIETFGPACMRTVLSDHKL